MYSITAILQKQPAAIAGALRSVLFVLILAGVLLWDEKLLSAVGLALEVVLTLFVVSSSTPTNNATLKAGTEVKVQGTSDTVIVQASPPGPVGVEGGADAEAQG